jgi:hypothetical protein
VSVLAAQADDHRIFNRARSGSKID